MDGNPSIDRDLLLCLVRHGEAKSAAEDPHRGLTDQGKQAAKRVATWVAAVGLPIGEIRHSGKLRAQQTADIFARHLSTSVQVTATAGLDPLDDVRPVAEKLDRAGEYVMLVGHLPFLSRLVSLLIL